MDLDDLDFERAGAARSSTHISSSASSGQTRPSAACANSNRADQYKSSTQQQKSATDAYFEAQMAKEMLAVAPDLKQAKTLAKTRIADQFDDEFSEAFEPSSASASAAKSETKRPQLKERKVLKPSTKQQSMLPSDKATSPPPVAGVKLPPLAAAQLPPLNASTSNTLSSLTASNSTTSLAVPSSKLDISAADAIASESAHNPLSPSLSRSIALLTKDAQLQQTRQAQQMQSQSHSTTPHSEAVDAHTVNNEFDAATSAVDQAAALEPAATTTSPLAAVAQTTAAPVLAAKPDAPTEALDEWDRVTADRAIQEAEQRASDDAAAANDAAIGIKSTAVTRATPTNYEASLTAQCAREDLPLLLSTVQLFDFRLCSAWTRFRCRVFGPPSLSSEKLLKERDEYFALSKAAVTHARVEDERMLCSLYVNLLGDALCPTATGSHWELLGFQGTDPVTDIRGAGVYGLISLLYIVARHGEMTQRVYRLSRDSTQSFPFALIALTISGIVMQLMRQCKLYALINQEAQSSANHQPQSLHDTVNRVYTAILYDFYLTWKNENCSIKNWNQVRQRIETRTVKSSSAEKNIRLMIDKLNKSEQQKQPKEKTEFTVIP